MFKSITRRVLEWHRIRRAVQKLDRFDDHLLADMGIPRHEIAARVKGEICP